MKRRGLRPCNERTSGGGSVKASGEIALLCDENKIVEMDRLRLGALHGIIHDSLVSMWEKKLSTEATREDF